MYDALRFRSINLQNNKNINKSKKQSNWQKLSNALLRIVSHRTYWVFRRYRQVDSFNNPEGAIVEEAFALHFVEPFKSKREAQKAIDFAKQLQPFQEFIIL